MVLPNLYIKCNHDAGWSRTPREATPGKLESLTFDSNSEHVWDLLEAIEKVAHTSSTHNMLSWIHTSCS